MTAIGEAFDLIVAERDKQRKTVGARIASRGPTSPTTKAAAAKLAAYEHVLYIMRSHGVTR